jgi:acyl-CoA hydrolase
MSSDKSYTILSAEEAASLIPSGALVALIIEATEISRDSWVYLTTGIGNAPTFLKCAEKVIIELNAYLEHGAMLPDLNLGQFEAHSVVAAG